MQNITPTEQHFANQLDIVNKWLYIFFKEFLAMLCSKEVYILGIFFGCYIYFVYLDHYPNLILSYNNFDILLTLGFYGTFLVLFLAFCLIFPAVAFLNIKPETKIAIVHTVKSRFSKKFTFLNTKTQINRFFLLIYITTLMVDFLIFLLLIRFLFTLINFSLIFLLWLAISSLKNIFSYWWIKKKLTIKDCSILFLITLASLAFLATVYYPTTRLWDLRQSLISIYLITSGLIIFSAVCAKFIINIKLHQINKNTIALIIFFMLFCTIFANKLAHTSFRFASNIFKNCHLGGYSNASIYVTENGANYFNTDQIFPTNTPKKFEIKNINVLLTSQGIYYINYPNSTIVINLPEQNFISFANQ